MKINIESVPEYVQFYPRDQATLDHEVAQAMLKFAKPGFWMTTGFYTAAIAARRASAMPITVEMYLIEQRAEHADYRANITGHHSIGAAVPPLGAAPRAIPLKEMTREQAARHLTKAEFLEWDLSQKREGKA